MNFTDLRDAIYTQLDNIVAVASFDTEKTGVEFCTDMRQSLEVLRESIKQMEADLDKYEKEAAGA